MTSTDHIRYDVLARDAMRGMLRRVMSDAAKQGLPGDHHFYITFLTTADGVKLSPRLMAQYPQEMTIILQHQFWDLVVTDDRFEVGLSFGGVPERLIVPVRRDQELPRPVRAVRHQLRHRRGRRRRAEDRRLPAPRSQRPPQHRKRRRRRRRPTATASLPKAPRSSGWIASARSSLAKPGCKTWLQDLVARLGFETWPADLVELGLHDIQRQRWISNERSLDTHRCAALLSRDGHVSCKRHDARGLHLSGLTCRRRSPAGNPLHDRTWAAS